MPAHQIIPPVAEPVSLAEFKAHLRLERDDENDVLLRQIAAARAHVESMTRCVFVEQTWRAVYSQWPERRRITLPVAPVRRIAEIRVFDMEGGATIVPANNYLLQNLHTPPRLLLQSPLRAPTAYANGIEIDIVVGFGAPNEVPVPLKEAILRLATQLFEKRSETTVNTATGMIAALVAPYTVMWP